MFRPRGVLSSDAKYASPARIITVDEMLQYRDAWTDPPCPDFDFNAILVSARTEVEPSPVKPLVMSEKGFRPADHAHLSTVEKVTRFTQASLNKLTDANFDAIVEPCLSNEVLTPATIPTIVDQIFGKAMEESLFASPYARFAVRLAAFENEKIGSKEVRKSIVSKSQKTFEETFNLQFSASASEEEKMKIRKRKLANIVFIGELYRNNLLSDKIIHTILHEIMNGPLPSEVEIEIVVNLLSATGAELESRNKQACEKIYQRLDALVNAHSKKFSNMVLFQMMNLLDLRANGWKKKEEKEERKATLQFLPPAAPSSLPSASAEPHKCQLPTKLSSAGVREIIELVRVSAAEQEWSGTEKNLAQSLKLVAEITRSKPLVVYTVANHACSINDTVEAKHMFWLLRSSVWGTHEVYKGMAWCIANGIVENILEDVPKYYSRFSANVTHFIKTHGEIKEQSSSTVSSAYCGVLRDVFGLAATMLSAAFAEHEGDATWELNFVNIWEMFLDEVKTQSCEIPKIGTTLDALSAVPTTQFFFNVLPDMLYAMTKRGICTSAELLKWKTSNRADPNKVLLVSRIADTVAA